MFWSFTLSSNDWEMGEQRKFFQSGRHPNPFMVNDVHLTGLKNRDTPILGLKGWSIFILKNELFGKVLILFWKVWSIWLNRKEQMEEIELGYTLLSFVLRCYLPRAIKLVIICYLIILMTWPLSDNEIRQMECMSS